MLEDAGLRKDLKFNPFLDRLFIMLDTDKDGSALPSALGAADSLPLTRHIRDHVAGILLGALAAMQGYSRREVATYVSYLLPCACNVSLRARVCSAI